MIREPHKHLFFELKSAKPPTIFVDNNYGFVVYLPFTGGYKNTSLRYSSIKEVAGLNVYSSSESIGVCIFKNDTMFSCLDMAISDFFETTISSSASVSVLYATRVSLTHVVVSAVANVNPAEDEVLFASKVFVLDGAKISIPTMIVPERITEKERDLYTSLYNSDGSYKGEPIEDKFITYEGYNDSTGFGSIGVEQISFSEGTEESVLTLTNKAIRDMIAVYPELSPLNVPDAYSIKSMRHNDSLFFVGLAKEKIFSIEVKEDNYEYSEWIFASQLEQSRFDNVLSQQIDIIPTYKKGLMSDYVPTYTPMGIVLEHKKFDQVVITRPEKNDDGENILSEYIVMARKNDDEEIELSPKLNAQGELEPTLSVRTDVEPTSSRYAFGISLKAVNPSAYMETDIAARNLNTVHKLADVGSIPGQDDKIVTVKSMCDVIPYQ